MLYFSVFYLKFKYPLRICLILLFFYGIIFLNFFIEEKLMSKPLLKIENLSKAFGETRVLQNLSFEVFQGEFLCVLGASGCGKTTLLRLISGLEEVDAGKIILGDEDITFFAPNKREVNTVFQNYALFPHMTVFDNVAYSLKIKGIKKDEVAFRVREALELVNLSGFETRYPSQLSGGQKQRVAIARAVISHPKLLLLDEPLGALDLNLRKKMQTELKNLQKTLGITFIYITHDQEEALNMADRIAVMNDGGFVQLDSPQKIYDSPKNTFVARFIGEANVLKCTFVSSCEGGARVSFGENELLVRTDKTFSAGETVFVAVRGEKISVLSGASAGIMAKILSLNFSGGIMKICAECLGSNIVAYRYGLDASVFVGQEIFLNIEDFAGVITDE